MTPLLIGCSVPQRVQRPLTGAASPNGCSAPQRVQRPIIRNDCDGTDVDEEW